MSRAGVLINPSAGRGNGKGLALARRLQNNGHIELHVLKEFAALPDVLAQFAAAGVTDLFISSGDGTIQAVQTLIAERQIFRQLPQLCLLPHGTTNMTAADIGYRHMSIETQARAIENLQFDDVQSRPTLRVINPRDGMVRHGMFLGSGSVADATLYCQRMLNDRGVTGSLATFTTLAKAVMKAAISKPNPADPNRFDRPYPTLVRRGDSIICNDEQLFVICTTLQRLILRTRPFWGGKSGPVRVTIMPYPVPNVFRWLLPLMYGGEGRSAPPGAYSFCSDRFQIDTPSVFVLDGEFFEGPEHEALRVESGQMLSYILS
jgi:diacylglycerol kinase (ATP)